MKKAKRLNKPTEQRDSSRSQRKPAPHKDTSKESGERINRYLSACGICSRREADRWIHEGRITLNGKKVEQPGIKIGKGDIVAVDGKPVTPATGNSYILYNKPRGLLCSRKDARGRPLIYDHLDVPANVQSVGRLDMDSEGLLLLTDNGALAQALIHPGAGIIRQYRVRITGQLSEESLAKLRNGGIDMGRDDVSDPWEVSVDSEAKGHSWVTVTIKRGRWREVRRTLGALKHEVRRLMRVRFGPIRLDQEMPSGSWRPLTSSELKQLKRVAGITR